MVKKNNLLFFSNKKVLEVGSLNINGTMRDFFNDCDYTGIDVGEGKDVDFVCSGHEYNSPDETYDVCTSGECFEHNPYWAETFANMVRMTKSGGLVFFTCATTGRPEHGTSRTSPSKSPLTIGKGWDYYRNLDEDDFRNSFNESFDDIFEVYEFHSTVKEPLTEFIKQLKGSKYSFSKDLYFWGIKK
jgi:SAM-dependent methyltransferase